MTSSTHTPGPWRWFGNRSGGVYLATAHSGRKYVMGFQRYGMNGAQPAFRVDHIMVPAAELVEFAVGDGTARGFKEGDRDPSVYRYDVIGIDSPDARLIAAAPELLEALEAMVRDADRSQRPGGGSSVPPSARAAISKARGHHD